MTSDDHVSLSPRLPAGFWFTDSIRRHPLPTGSDILGEQRDQTQLRTLRRSFPRYRIWSEENIPALTTLPTVSRLGSGIAMQKRILGAGGSNLGKWAPSDSYSHLPATRRSTVSSASTYFCREPWTGARAASGFINRDQARLDMHVCLSRDVDRLTHHRQSPPSLPDFAFSCSSNLSCSCDRSIAAVGHDGLYYYY